MVGIGGFGQSKDGSSLRDKAKACWIELVSEELPERQMATRSFFYGPPPDERWVQELHHQIGAPRNAEVLLFPVAGVEQFVCLVYADNGREDSSIRNLDLIEVAAGQTALIIENRFLRKRLERYQHHKK